MKTTRAHLTVAVLSALALGTALLTGWGADYLDAAPGTVATSAGGWQPDWNDVQPADTAPRT